MLNPETQPLWVSCRSSCQTVGPVISEARITTFIVKHVRQIVSLLSPHHFAVTYWFHWRLCDFVASTKNASHNCTQRERKVRQGQNLVRYWNPDFQIQIRTSARSLPKCIGFGFILLPTWVTPLSIIYCRNRPMTVWEMLINLHSTMVRQMETWSGIRSWITTESYVNNAEVF